MSPIWQKEKIQTPPAVVWHECSKLPEVFFEDAYRFTELMERDYHTGKWYTNREVPKGSKFFYCPVCGEKLIPFNYGRMGVGGDVETLCQKEPERHEDMRYPGSRIYPSVKEWNKAHEPSH